MGELGLLGIPWPEELGGAGLDLLSYMIAIHEMAKVDASHAITISAHTTLGTSPIVNFGTDEQKKRYVPLLATGKVLGGFGLTEPSAGSDAAGTRTTAVRKNGHYVLNGSQALHHARRRRRDLRRHRRHRPGTGNEGHQLVHPHQGTSDLDKVAAIGIGHDDSLPAMRGFPSRARRRTSSAGARPTPAS